MKKLNKKGFTLTEMIVVIAIIGILAGVLIPTITGYIKRANRSNDEQLAASMTDEIERYCLENSLDQNSLIGTDIRTILIAKGFNLVPSRDDWTYVYNVNKKSIEVLDINKQGTISADNDFSPSDPTNIIEDYYLIGKGNSTIEVAVTALCTGNIDGFNDLVSSVPSKYQTIINEFDPKSTLYVNNVSSINTPSEAIKKVVFVELTYNLPNITNLGIVLGKDENGNNIKLYIPEIICSVNEFTKNKLNNLFQNYKSVNSKENYLDIDLSNFNLETDESGNTLNAKFTFGDLVEQSINQTFAVDIIGYTSSVKDSNNDGVIDATDKIDGKYVRESRLVYEVTVIYYGTDGIIAKGSKILLSKVISSDFAYGAELQYPYIPM